MNDTATATNDAPASSDKVPATTANTSAQTTKNDDQNTPENSTPVSSATAPALGICTDTAELPTVLAEATKKDENIVKVDYFPVKSQQQDSTVEPQVLESEIRSTKYETNSKASKKKIPNACAIRMP